MYPCFICGRLFNQFELELHVQNDHSAIDENSEYVDVNKVKDTDDDQIENPTGFQI